MNEIRINTIYKCDYKQLSNTLVKVWLVDYPKISAKEQSIGDCEEKLDQILTDEHADILPVFDYVRPLPDSEYPYICSSDQYIVLGAYERGELQNDVNKLFNKDTCELCKRPTGKRNKKVLEIHTGKTNADLLHVSVCLSDIVSEKLVDAFDLKRFFEVREVIMTSGTRRKYFELIPLSAKQILIPVAIKEDSFMLGRPEFYACPKCDTKSTVYLGEKGFNYVVEDKTLLNNYEAYQINGNLVISRLIWNKLIKSGSKFKRVATSQLGIANSSNIIRNPNYKTIGE